MSHDPSIHFNEVISKSIERIRSNILNFGQKFPSFGDGTSYRLTDNRDWLASFWAGLVWLAYAATQDSKLRAYARSLLPSFERRLTQHIHINHDLGFLFCLSARAQWQLDEDRHARKLALQAAEMLAGRYNPKGEYIQAWGEIEDEQESGRFIIDCMMNLPLLFWAAKETGESHYYEKAFRHAQTTLTYLIRDDGSTHHTFIMNPATGQPIGPRTHQGYTDESLWSRGQAWAIYGFALAAEWTGESRFLEAARQTADRFMAEAPEDTLPPWDLRLDAAAPQHPDSSASAIAASGMLRIATLLNSGDATDFRTQARQLLSSLVTMGFDTRPQAQGLLKHGTVHANKGWGIDSYTIFGDYFFLEALMTFTSQAPDFWGRPSEPTGGS